MTIISILAAMVMPLSELSVKRTREIELRRELRQIRAGLDTYKKKAKAGEFGDLPKEASGFPASLQVLVETKILRRIPVDPITRTKDWGTRSFTDPAGSYITDGRDVYDVFSRSQKKAIDKTEYRTW